MRPINRRNTNRLRPLLDEWLPPVFRESGVFRWVARRWLGPGCPVDLKRRAFSMSDREFIAAYATVGGAYADRPSDTTEDQVAWLLGHIEPGSAVLELGPGNRATTARLLELGARVHTLDLHASCRLPGENLAVGVAERLPFKDRAFDIAIAAHVIEHVRSLGGALRELERVTRYKVLIVTPRQRYYDVTFDYHLHFFYSLAHLASNLPTGRAEGCEIDGDLCLLWKLQ